MYILWPSDTSLFCNTFQRVIHTLIIKSSPSLISLLQDAVVFLLYSALTQPPTVHLLPHLPNFQTDQFWAASLGYTQIVATYHTQGSSPLSVSVPSLEKNTPRYQYLANGTHIFIFQLSVKICFEGHCNMSKVYECLVGLTVLLFFFTANTCFFFKTRPYSLFFKYYFRKKGFCKIFDSVLIGMLWNDQQMHICKLIKLIYLNGSAVNLKCITW